MHLSFLVFNILLIYFRHRGRGGEREGEKHQCVVASHVLRTGDLTWPTTQASALTGNGTSSSLVLKPALNPHQSGCAFILIKEWSFPKICRIPETPYFLFTWSLALLLLIETLPLYAHWIHFILLFARKQRLQLQARGDKPLLNDSACLASCAGDSVVTNKPGQSGGHNDPRGCTRAQLRCTYVCAIPTMVLLSFSSPRCTAFLWIREMSSDLLVISVFKFKLPTQVIFC